MSILSIFLFCRENGSWVSFSLKSVNSDPWIVIGRPHLLVGPRTARRHLAPTLGATATTVLGFRRRQPTHRGVPDELLRTRQGGSQRPRREGRRRDEEGRHQHPRCGRSRWGGGRPGPS